MSAFRFNVLIKKSLADLWHRKGRTLLIICGILIGVMGLTAVDNSADALLSAFAFQQAAPTPPDINLTVGHLDPALLASITALPNVRAVQTASVYDTLWHVDAPSGSVGMRIMSYPNLQHIPLTPFQLIGGRYPRMGEIVLDSSDYVLQSFTVGQSITVETSQGTVHLRVVGVARTAGLRRLLPPSSSGTAIGYMSDAGLQQAFVTPQSTAPESTSHLFHMVSSVALRLQSPSQAQATTDAILSLVSQYQVGSLGLGAFSTTTINLALIDGFFTLLRLLASMALILTALLIINTVSTLIAEQTQVVGVMKALGGRSGPIFASYLFSVGCASLVGTALGVMLGLLCGNQLATWLATAADLDLGPLVIAPWVVIASLVTGIGISLAAAGWPLLRGTRMTVRDALAAHGVSQSSGQRSGPGGLLRGGSLVATVGVRGIFRKPGRAFVTVLTLTLAGTTFLAVQMATYAITQHVNHLYSAYQVDIQLNQGPTFDQIRDRVLAVPNINLIEPWDQAAFRTRWGQLDLAGVEPQTQIYQHHLLSGQWFTGDESHALVLSDQAAHQMGLRVGDTLTFSDLPEQGIWTVIGTVDDPSGNFGDLGAAVTTLANFNLLTGNAAGDVHAEMIQARDRSPAAIATLAFRLDLALNPPRDHQAEITTIDQQIHQRQQGYAVLIVSSNLLTFLLGLTGILGLLTTLATEVIERQHEIGIMRALGSGGWPIARTFWIEGLTLSLLAWGIGLVIGIPVAYGFLLIVGRLLLSVPFAVSPIAFGEMLLVLLIIASVASVGPSLRATRLHLAQLLQYE